MTASPLPIAGRVLLTWTLVCLAPQTGLTHVLASVEPPLATEAEGAPPEPDVAEPPRDTVVVTHHGGSRIRIGGSIVVERGERVEDAVAVFGSIIVRGEVTGDAVAIGGGVHVEDGASVGGEVVAIGGRIVAAPTAKLSGRGEQIAFDFPHFSRVGPDGADVVFNVLPDWPRIVGAMVGVAIFRVVALLLIGLAVAVIFSGTVARTADRAAANPLEALVVGVGLLLVAFPLLFALSLALAISVIGLPLVPVVLLIAGALWTVGFVGAVAAAGRGALRAVGVSGPSLAASFLVGGLPFAAITIGSRLAWLSSGSMSGWVLAATIAGLVLEAAFWSIGAGAILLGRLRRDTPLPAAAEPPPPAPPLPVQF